MGILRKLFQPSMKKHFFAWQIELTTRCPLQCTMCVKEGRTDYSSKDMSLDDFKKILPYLKYVENVVLEGWGESLMHRNLADCIRMVKAVGSRAGFVTCGKGLDEGYAEEILEAGIDFIGFSFSGATRRTHEAIRINSDFDALIRSIRHINRLGASKGKECPQIHIVFLLLKNNIDEVLPLINLAGDLGIENVVLVNMIQVSNQKQDSEKVFVCEGLSPYETLMQEAEEKARCLNIRLTRPDLSPRQIFVCSENPLKNLYISVEGEVSPCVFLHPPTLSSFGRIFCDEKIKTEKVSFGNIFSEPFEAIWNKEDYLAFRESFSKRKRIEDNIRLANLDLRQAENSKLPEPPVPCRSCHKILGV